MRLRTLITAFTLLGVTAFAPAAAAGSACAGGALAPGSGPLPGHLTAASWMVADLDTGAVLGECGANDPHPPASTLKLLTIVTVLPRLDPARLVTVTREDLDFEPGSSAVGLVEGGTYSVETLLLGLLLVSGNDAANVLARVAGGPGGRAATIHAMNATATALGAQTTRAVTPHGLDAPGQQTSARDLAIIARAAFARADFRRLVATPTAQIPPQHVTLPDGQARSYPGYQIQNDNLLLRTYRGAIGGKTGFTDVARHTYVGAAERGGRRLVVTLMRGEQVPVRIRLQAAALLDWGFAVPRGALPVDRLPAVPPVLPAPSGSAGSGAAGSGAAGSAPHRPEVLAEVAVRHPGRASAPRAGGSGVGTALLSVLGTLTVLVAALRVRVRLRLARRRRVQAARRPYRRPAPPRTRPPGSGRPAPARHPRSRDRVPSRAYRSR
jgi:D-alanyl-D-alanine carboxypeptidase (penicillin-binding protein 5/6)